MKTEYPMKGANLILSSILLLAAGMMGASAEELTFFAYSDSHYEPEDTGNRLEVGQMNSLPGTAWPAEFGGVVGTPKGVIMAGDLIDDGARSDLYPAQWANWSADYGANKEGRCDFPVFEGVGNHDMNTNLFMFNKVAERNIVRQNAGLIDDIAANGYHYSWDWDGIHFINLNLFPGNIWEGEADSYGSPHHPQHARDYLLEDLQTHMGDSGKPVVVIHHFRPVDDNWWTYSSADKYQKTLQDYNVIMIMCGHQGGGVNNIWRGINWASSNGNVEAYRVSDNTLSIAMRGASSWGQTFQKGFFRSYATSGLAAVINNGEWATNVTPTSATLSGKLLHAAVTSTEVTVHWGTTDGGTNSGAWEHSASLGAQTPNTGFSTGITGLQTWQNYYYRCSATNSQGTVWAAASIPFKTDGALPGGWGSGFVGYEQRPWGGANENVGTFTVIGSGRDIGENGQGDNFQYAYRSLDGDGEIKTRITSSVVNSREPKVGIMMRETLNADSRNVSLLLIKNETTRLMSRLTTGGATSAISVNPPAAPYWVKLSRIGDSFTGYQSPDGSSWTQVGSPITIAMASNISVGLAVTAGNRDGSKNHTATFDNVTVSGLNSPSTPSISAIANQELNVSGSTGPLAFTVVDLETEPGLLDVTTDSSNLTLVPLDKITLGGSGANRTVSVTPVSGQEGSATITVTVSDGALTSQESFLVTVIAGQLLVSEWQSLGDHGAASYDLAIPAPGTHESRQSGISRIGIRFSEAIVVPDLSAAVTITGIDSSGPVTPSDFGIATNVSIAPAGDTLLVDFSDGGGPGALPDAARWRFLLNPATIKGSSNSSLTASPATTRVITSLIGDFNGDGRVTGIDLNAISNAGSFNPANPDSLRADVNGDGAINSLDFDAAWLDRTHRTDTLSMP